MWCFGEGLTWWSWFGGAGMIILWIGIAALMVWGIVSLTGRNRYNARSNSIEIARERYAKGEISRDEYEQYRRDL